MNLYVLGLRERVGGCMYAFFFVGENMSKVIQLVNEIANISEYKPLMKKQYYILE